MDEMRKQAEHVGTEIVSDHIAKADLSRRPFRLEGDGGDVYTADALIIATGAQAKWLELPVRADVPRLRRLGLRDVRRLLLPRQGRDRDRRRQYGGRGGALPRQHRRERHGDPSPRPVPRREDPAGPALRHPKISVVWNSIVEEVRGKQAPSA